MDRRARGAFPLGTLVVNGSGCFVAGLLAGVLHERLLVSPPLRSLLLIGFLGGYTTFSSFSLETVRLAEDGSLTAALLNVGGSVLLGLLGTWLGLGLARAG